MYISSMMFKYLLYILLILFKTTFAYSEIVNDIKVNGNDRVSKETVILFSDIKKGDDIDNSTLNKSLKNLYETNFFEDVKVSFDNQVLLITVKELPVIQEIIINGIKRKTTVKEIKDAISLKEKNPFNQAQIKNDLNLILNLFKQTGYYLVDAKVKVVDNNNGTVNIVYDIDRGERASITKIEFIGDKKFKNRKLHSIITSEESKFWKFISNKKYLNIERINLDKRLLKNFYLNKGYYNVQINDAYSSIINNEEFILTFNIDAGKKYFFGDLTINLPEDFDPKKFKNLNKTFLDLKGKKYSQNDIQKILDEIDKIALFENYEFIDANVIETVNNDKVDFNFDILETKKVYVKKINILGNNITSEEFIRNQLIVDEGDPFNKILHNKSINILKSKGIFGSVSSRVIDTDENDQKIIDLIIEEKATGEISAAAGFGTDGSSISLGIAENNFNGKGINLEGDISIGEDSVKGSLSYTHPNFAYSDRALTTSLQVTTTDKLKDYGYKSSLNRAALGTSYQQFENFYFSPSISISSEKIETASNASTAYKKQEGSYFDTLLNYSLSYDKTNSPFQPTDGFYSSFFQELPLASDQLTIVNGYTFTSYNELGDDFVVSAGIYTRAVNSLENNKDVRVSKRLYAPQRRLRGFETGKVGPKDGEDYVGGNYVATANISTTVPFIFQTLENTDVKIFFDAGNVWGVDYSNTIDESNKLRSSTGVALEFLTPLGPLSFSFAETITKASTDVTESFRFQLGTTF